MKKVDFKKILGYLKRKKRKDRLEIRPDRDWRIVLTIFLVSLVAIISIQLFLVSRLGDVSGLEVEFMSAKKINSSLFNEAINDIESKEARFRNLLRSKPETKDPSI